MLKTTFGQFVGEKLREGFSTEEVRTRLKRNGWSLGQVEKIVHEAKAKNKVWTKIDEYTGVVFRIGLGILFLANSITAMVEPGSFLRLIRTSLFGHYISDPYLMLAVIGVTDMFLGIMLLFGMAKRFALVWAGIWLFIVAVVKLSSLFHIQF